MKRAIPIGPVDLAAIRTAGGRVRLRMLLTIEQIERLLEAARNGDVEDDDDRPEEVRPDKAPQPTPEPTQRVFVIEGTRAWQPWVNHKRRTSGNADWYLTTTHVVDGKKRTGWWFPSLFPPNDAPATGPPTSPTMTREDDAAMADEWNAGRT